MREPLPLEVPDFPEEVMAALGAVQRLSYPPQGDTSTIVIVESAGGKYAVKRSRGARFSGWLSQEYQVLLALAGTPLPTPQPRVFVQREGAGEPESWLVMEALPGEPLVAAAEKAANRTEWHDLLREFGHILASIHRAAVPAELQGETRPWLDRVLERAEHALRHYPVDGDAALLETLKRQRPPPVPPALIHGDFTVDNVLISAGTVTGVIDWAGGGPGDPRYDLALAIRPQATGLFQTPRDRQAFFEGYGLADLSWAEYEYFVRLYEFF